jgi:hypothetical protein
MRRFQRCWDMDACLPWVQLFSQSRPGVSELMLTTGTFLERHISTISHKLNVNIHCVVSLARELDFLDANQV